MAGSLVQAKFGTRVGSGTSCTVSGNAVGAGNALVVFGIVEQGAGQSFNTPTDTLSNTYTLILSDTTNSSGWDIYAWIASNITGGANTITATCNGGNLELMIAFGEIAGVTTSPLDGSAQQYTVAPGTGTNAISSGNGTNANTAFAFCFCGQPGQTTNTIAAGTGFTASANTTTWYAGGEPALLESRASLAAGNHAATYTDTTNGGSNSYQVAIVMLDEKPVTFGSVIQSNSVNDTSVVASHALTFASPVQTSGSTLFAVMTLLSGALNPSVSDSLNGSWGTFDIAGGGAGPLTYIFSKPSSKGGACTVTVTLGTAGALAWWIGEVALLAPANILDASGINVSSAGTSPSTVSTSKPILYTTEFLLGAVGTTSATTGSGTGSGFSIDANGQVSKLIVGTRLSNAAGVTWLAGYGMSPVPASYTALISTYVGQTPIPVGIMIPSLAQCVVQ